MRTLTDDRLVSLAAAGNAPAFEDIYARYYQDVYRYALSILRDPQDAQDVLQGTMERALRSIGNQRVEGGLRAWLFRIAHNESMDLIRRRPTAPPPESPLLAPDAASDAGERERMRQLLADLGTLPERQRSALVLRELSGLDSEEIGTALSISPSAAKQSVYEARVALTALADGRDMSCERVQKRISAGDGRRLRGRRVRAHIRDCVVCQAFTAGIEVRTADLPGIFPPIAAIAAAKAFGAITAGASAAGGGSSAGAGAGVATGPVAPRARGHRAATVSIGAVTLLALAGALGASRVDDPGATKAVAAEEPAAPAARSRGQARSPSPPPTDPTRPRARSNSVAAPSTQTGYSQLEPSVTALLAPDVSDAGTGSGDGGDGAGSSDAAGGDGLAFTGLDVLLLLATGLGLLGLGLVTRRAVGRPLP